MRIGILGPLEVVADDGGAVPLGGARARAGLVRLALDPGRLVATSTLIRDLWRPDEQPAHPTHAVQRLMSRLRGALPDTVLAGVPGGYRLDLRPEDVDAGRHARLAESGRAALVSGDPDTAVDLLSRAERLWRGAALADLGAPPFADATLTRLTEERLRTNENRFEAELARGNAEPVLAELTETAGAHPLRERLQGQLIRALYGTGRQSDALAAFERLRSGLAEALGADPSAELSRLHRAMLRHDPALSTGDPVGVRSIPDSPRSEPTGRVTGPGPASGALPVALTSFVGRDAELAELPELLARHRLVTIVGPGGAGKSRLAGELLARLGDPESAGVDATADPAVSSGGGSPLDAWFVDLTPVRTETELLRTVHTALDLRESVFLDSGRYPTGDGFDRLARALGHRRALIVLDNCEHVIDIVAGFVARLLSACPRLRVIGTSREPIRIGGERPYPIPSLPAPAPGSTVAETLRCPAARLLLDRAANVRPGFTVTDGNVAAVGEICRRLDGQPLALELAAARLSSFGPEQIVAHLDDRFRLLSNGSRAAPPRHRTLRAVVAWSWDLLDDPERTLARRMSVFSGPVDLTAVAAICSGGDLADVEVVTALAGLADKSLVEVTGPDGAPPRYRMLETIRAFAAEQLTDAAETDTYRAAHLTYFLDVAENAEPRLRTTAQLSTLARLRADRADLFAALHWAVDHSPASAVRLCAALRWSWVLHGVRADPALIDRILALPGDGLSTARALIGTVHCFAVTGLDSGDPADGRRYLAAARDHVAAAEPHPLLSLLEPLAAVIDRDLYLVRQRLESLVVDPRTWVRSMALLFRGLVGDGAGHTATVLDDLRAARRGFEELGDHWGLSIVAQSMASMHSLDGDSSAAIAAYRDALANIKALGAMSELSTLLAQVGNERVRTADPAAGDTLHRALVLARRHGNPIAAALTRIGLGNLAVRSRDWAAAREHFESVVGGGEYALEPLARIGLAGIAIVMRDLDTAARQLRVAARSAYRAVDLVSLSSAVHTMARMLAAQDDPRRAAMLIGAGTRVRGGFDFGDVELARFATEMQRSLGTEEYRKSFDRGRNLSDQDLMDLFGLGARELSDVRSPRASRRRGPATASFEFPGNADVGCRSADNPARRRYGAGHHAHDPARVVVHRLAIDSRAPHRPAIRPRSIGREAGTWPKRVSSRSAPRRPSRRNRWC